MFKIIHFPIKGTYYYAAELAIENALIQPNTQLKLKPEPDNPYDKHAVQIWLPTHSQKVTDPNPFCPIPQLDTSDPVIQTTQSALTGLLLGYVPRQLAPFIEEHLNNQSTLNPQVIHKASLGKTIEIDCAVKLKLTRTQSLKLFITSLWVKSIHAIQKLFHFFTR